MECAPDGIELQLLWLLDSAVERDLYALIALVQQLPPPLPLPQRRARPRQQKQLRLLGLPLSKVLITQHKGFQSSLQKKGNLTNCRHLLSKILSKLVRDNLSLTRGHDSCHGRKSTMNPRAKKYSDARLHILLLPQLQKGVEPRRPAGVPFRRVASGQDPNALRRPLPGAGPLLLGRHPAWPCLPLILHILLHVRTNPEPYKYINCSCLSI